MEKAFIGFVVGVFLGAFAVELYRRKRPAGAKLLETRAAKAAHAVVDAFREGYAGSSAIEGRMDGTARSESQP